MFLRDVVYTWRGKRHRGVAPLLVAVCRVHGDGCRLSFDADAMVVSVRDPETRQTTCLRYARDLATQEIASEPSNG